MLHCVEFRNDNLRSFSKKEEATIGSSYHELLVPSVQTLHKQGAITIKNSGVAGMDLYNMRGQT